MIYGFAHKEFSSVNETSMWIFSSYFPEEWAWLDENGLQWNSIALKMNKRKIFEIYELRHEIEKL